jgi:hypothetical protein
MSNPDIAGVEKKLDEIVAQLKATNDPERKRALLKQMRTLMAQLDSLVFDQTRFLKSDQTG